ncbi:MAG: DUF456 domain-containing protein [Treponema sp.]|nr:DUF456 domain-containing protein [Treponema sp.]MBQ7881354.1 DUF456 domain-containing protein [Treponema sp.]
MELDIFLVILSGLLFFLGLLGTFAPILPGIPLAWIGLLLSHFCSYTQTKIWILVVTGILSIAVMVLDTILQPWLTKKSGGSKAGIWGSTIGLFISLFLGPIFVIIAPFLGAFIGELLNDSSDIPKALKAAFGTFKGFLLGTGIKMITIFIFIWIFVFNLLF